MSLRLRGLRFKDCRKLCPVKPFETSCGLTKYSCLTKHSPMRYSSYVAHMCCRWGRMQQRKGEFSFITYPNPKQILLNTGTETLFLLFLAELCGRGQCRGLVPPVRHDRRRLGESRLRQPARVPVLRRPETLLHTTHPRQHQGPPHQRHR